MEEEDCGEAFGYMYEGLRLSEEFVKFPETEDGLRLNQCDRCMVVKRVCYQCKQVFEEEDYGEAFDYMYEGLRLIDELVKFVCGRRTEACLSKQKLHLVLDLDHTLIDARLTVELSNENKRLIQKVGSRDDLAIVIGDSKMPHLVKLRPFVREFLRKASDLFEMYVYTKGTKRYAAEIVRFLDPQRVYFKDRVITRRESPGKFKSLDLVLAEERGVIVLDDSPEVWPDHRTNLLIIRRYHYYERRNLKSESESKKNIVEDDKDCALAMVLEFLEGFHTEFFRDEIDGRDVREMLIPHYHSCAKPSYWRFFGPCYPCTTDLHIF